MTPETPQTGAAQAARSALSFVATRPVAITMLMIALGVFGMVSFSSLPVEDSINKRVILNLEWRQARVICRSFSSQGSYQDCKEETDQAVGEIKRKPFDAENCSPLT